MDIEPKLRDMLALRDPGTRFTDKVLARLGDVPSGPSRDGVANIADARSSRRGRRLLLGVLLVAGAAAATLPFMRGRVDEQAAPQAAGVAAPEAAAGDASAAALDAAPAVRADADTLSGCIDPDVLYGLLLPGSTREFRVATAVPPELADFKPPPQLTWLGATERLIGPTATSTAVYRSELAPAAARTLAREALEAGGWRPHLDDLWRGSSVFVSAAMPSGETYCRGSQQFTLTVSSLDGVTYAVLAQARRESGSGSASSCARSPQPVARGASVLDQYMPVLELPSDPGTGQVATLLGYSGGGSVSDAKRRVSAEFRLNESVATVARHFAGQMTAQGWRPETDWSGEGTAGFTWTRRLDEETVLQGVLAVSAFEDHRFAAMFHIVRTN